MKHMKKALVGSVVTSALALTASHSAYAINYHWATDEAMDYLLSGATASAQFMRNSIISDVCVNPPAAIDLIADAGKHTTVYQKDKDDWVVVCQVQSGIDAGQPVVRFIKQGGGSGDGTTPVSDPANNAINYPNPDEAVFNPVTGQGTGVGTNLNGCGTGTTLATSASNETLPNTSRFIFFDDCDLENVSKQGGDHGTSDVEPQLFFDVNTPSTGNPFVDNGAITVKPLASLGFGVVVTTQLRNALQALQFPLASSCHPANADHGVLLSSTPGATVSIDVDGDGTNDTDVKVGQYGSGTFTGGSPVLSPSAGTATVGDSEACMPNLARSTVAGLFTGGITDWAEIQLEGTDLFAAAAAANTAAGSTVVKIPIDTSFGGAVPALDYTRVHFCRRNSGSGTNAQFQAYFLNRPCSARLNPTTLAVEFLGEAMINPGATTGDFSAATVALSNRGSSDLSRCLEALDTSTDMVTHGAKVGDELFDNGAFGDLGFSESSIGVDTNQDGVVGTAPILVDQHRFAWGIGYQSVEKGNKLTDGFNFVKIDGFAPTVQETYAGNYFDAYEQTCQRRTAHTPVDTRLTSTVMVNAFDTICAGNSGAIFEANTSFLHPWGEAGWLRVPDGSGVTPPATVASLVDPNTPVPVNTWTRPGSSCAAPKTP